MRLRFVNTFAAPAATACYFWVANSLYLGPDGAGVWLSTVQNLIVGIVLTLSLIMSAPRRLVR